MTPASSNAWVLLGGGRHAAVLIDTLRAADAPLPVAILDADPSRAGQRVLGVPIRGGDQLLEELLAEGVCRFGVGVGMSTCLEVRRRLFNRARSRGLEPLSIVHPTAVCSPTATRGAGIQLLAQSVVNTGARLGENVLVNTAAVVEHDCWLDDHCHVASGARLAGSVEVGCNALVGAGAVVLPRVRVGHDAIVGAGAVVVRDVPPGAVVVGSPARVLRKVSLPC